MNETRHPDVTPLKEPPPLWWNRLWSTLTQELGARPFIYHVEHEANTPDDDEDKGWFEVRLQVKLQHYYYDNELNEFGNLEGFEQKVLELDQED